VLGNTVLDPTATWREVNLTGIDRHAYWIMPLFVVAQVPWYKLVGFGLIQLRLLSTAWGIVLLFAWWRILCRLAADRIAAWLTLFLLAVDFNVIFAASAGRMDMMAVALGSCGLAIYLDRREASLPQALFFGMSLVACACLTHPNGVFFSFDLLFLAMYFERRQFFQFRALLAATTPVALAIVGWGLYISRDSALFAAQFAGNAGGAQGRFFALLHPFLAFRNELVNRYFTGFGMPPFSEGASTLKVIVLAAWFGSAAAMVVDSGVRKTRGHRALLMLLTIHLTLLALLDGFQQSFYMIYVEPLFIAVFAVVMTTWWAARPQRRWLVAAYVAVVVLVHVAVTGGRMRVNPYRNRYLPALEFVRAQAESGKTVMASTEMALGLNYAYSVTDDYRLGYRSAKHPDVIVVDEGRYQPWIELLAGQDAGNYAYIQDILAHQYRLVYDRPGYKIYERR
jgi:hypothetical protein